MLKPFGKFSEDTEVGVTARLFYQKSTGKPMELLTSLLDYVIWSYVLLFYKVRVCDPDPCRNWRSYIVTETNQNLLTKGELPQTD